MNRLLNNWPLKITALVLSIGLWSHVRGESNPLETATFSVRLDTGSPGNWRVVASDAPKTVRVSVRAPHLELRSLGAATLPLTNPLASPETDAPPVLNGGLTASLDFSSAAKSSKAPQTLPIRVESKRGDVEILGVKPASASVVLETR